MPLIWIMVGVLVVLFIQFLCTKPKEDISEFDIEYFPIVNKYYPRHKGKYIYQWHCGYSLERNCYGCLNYHTQAGAVKLYKEYLETRGIGTQIIKPKLYA